MGRPDIVDLNPNGILDTKIVAVAGEAGTGGGGDVKDYVLQEGAIQDFFREDSLSSHQDVRGLVHPSRLRDPGQVA